jgi:hypothetical protein
MLLVWSPRQGRRIIAPLSGALIDRPTSGQGWAVLRGLVLLTATRN